MITVDQIHSRIAQMLPYKTIYVKEFTWESMRIDGIAIEIYKRWIRGFEIKVNRNDFLNDKKWIDYSRFCSSLSIVCPAELIKPEEVEAPFGLLWMHPDKYGRDVVGDVQWVKRPKNFQKRASMAWLYTYVEVLEKEFPRLYFEK